jgi:hypothetical protein
MDVRDVRLGEGGHAGQHAVSVGNQIIAPIAHMHVVIRDRSFLNARHLFGDPVQGGHCAEPIATSHFNPDALLREARPGTRRP